MKLCDFRVLHIHIHGRVCMIYFGFMYGHTGKQVHSQSKKGKEKENKQGEEKTSKGKKNTKGASTE